MDLARLQENEHELRSVLLPADPDVTEALEKRDAFLTHAYVVLASAILEEFVEECFRHFIETAAASEPDQFAGCFVTLASKFSTLIIGQHGSAVIASDSVATLKNLYDSKVITPNNGIRRRNLETLAKPLGLLPALEDNCEELLAVADALGSKRGAIAHVGVISEEIRPSKAEKLVADVIDNIPSLIKVLDL